MIILKTESGLRLPKILKKIDKDRIFVYLDETKRNFRMVAYVNAVSRVVEAMKLTVREDSGRIRISRSRCDEDKTCTRDRIRTSLRYWECIGHAFVL